MAIRIMPKLSPKKVVRQFEDYYIENLINAFNICIDRKQLKPFILDLFTDMEIRMLSKRLQIAVMLFDGYDYEAIRGRLKVTNQTISRISTLLDYGEGGLLDITTKICKIHEKVKDRLEKGPRSMEPYFSESKILPAVIEQGAKEILKKKRDIEVKRNITKERKKLPTVQ